MYSSLQTLPLLALFYVPPKTSSHPAYGSCSVQPQVGDAMWYVSSLRCKIDKIASCCLQQINLWLWREDAAFPGAVERGRAGRSWYVCELRIAQPTQTGPGDPLTYFISSLLFTNARPGAAACWRGISVP